MVVKTLKNKIQWTTGLNNVDKFGFRVFNIFDVKDAVEWLKKEMFNCFLGQDINLDIQRKIIRKIDLAFEDVTKK